jgi:hypothetical protein
VAISLALDLLSGFSCGIGVDAVEDVVVGSICGISAEEDAICWILVICILLSYRLNRLGKKVLACYRFNSSNYIS